MIQLNEKGNVPLPVMPPFLADSDEEESCQTFILYLKKPTNPLRLCCGALTQRDGGRPSYFLSGSPLYFLHIFTSNHRLGEIA